MSALEQHSLPSERRHGVRTRLDRVLRALIGRNEGVVVDLSLRGARLRHEKALQRGATVRVAFDWEGSKFAAGAEVLASRIITLGARDGEPAIYESRVRFASMTADALDVLAGVIAAIGTDELRTWVDNLQGYPEWSPKPSASPARGFIRCRYVFSRWQKKWTRDTSQPEDGFALPAATDAADIAALCRSWEAMDADARDLVRLTASAVIDHASGTNTFL